MATPSRLEMHRTSRLQQFGAIALAQMATPHSTQFDAKRLNCADTHLAVSNVSKLYRGNRMDKEEE